MGDSPSKAPISGHSASTSVLHRILACRVVLCEYGNFCVCDSCDLSVKTGVRWVSFLSCNSMWVINCIKLIIIRLGFTWKIRSGTCKLYVYVLGEELQNLWLLCIFTCVFYTV
jgi:hypothetical protein